MSSLSRTAYPLFLALCLSLFGPAGCGGLFKPKPAPDIYTLRLADQYAAEGPASQAQLVLAEPVSDNSLNTMMIAVKTGPEALKYYEGANWSGRAPSIFQNLMLASFEKSGKLPAVGRDTISLRPDYILQLDLRDFQAETQAAQVSVRVGFGLKIIDVSKARIVASKSFEATAAAGLEMSAVIRAFDEAAGNAVKQAASWTLQTLPQEAKKAK